MAVLSCLSFHYCTFSPAVFHTSLYVHCTYVHTYICTYVIVQYTCAFIRIALAHLQGMEQNWKHGHHTLKRIQCNSENSKGVYCLQYDDHKIVSGLRDNTIKVCLVLISRKH